MLRPATGIKLHRWIEVQTTGNSDLGDRRDVHQRTQDHEHGARHMRTRFQLGGREGKTGPSRWGFVGRVCTDAKSHLDESSSRDDKRPEPDDRTVCRSAYGHQGLAQMRPVIVPLSGLTVMPMTARWRSTCGPPAERYV